MAEIRQIDPQQVQKWSQNGAEVIWERGTARLRDFKKSLPADLEVTVFNKDAGTYVPLMLSCGRPLLCGEVLPERADLAIDENGRILSQGEFEQNLMFYRSLCIYPNGSEIGLEPIPYVVQYVKEMPDPWTESRGMIEIGTKYDSGEFKPKQRFGPNGETEEEWLRESKKNSADIASALNILAQNQTALQEFLMKQAGISPTPPPAPAPEPEPEPEPAPMQMTPAQVAEAVGQSTDETAPCGKIIRRGYLAQHQRFCNHEDCGGVGENTTGPEAA